MVIIGQECHHGVRSLQISLAIHYYMLVPPVRIYYSPEQAILTIYYCLLNSFHMGVLKGAPSRHGYAADQQSFDQE